LLAAYRSAPPTPEWFYIDAALAERCAIYDFGEIGQGSIPAKRSASAWARAFSVSAVIIVMNSCGRDAEPRTVPDQATDTDGRMASSEVLM